MEQEHRRLLTPVLKCLQVLQTPCVGGPPRLPLVGCHLIPTLPTQEGVAQPLPPAFSPFFSPAGEVHRAATFTSFPRIGFPHFFFKGRLANIHIIQGANFQNGEGQISVIEPVKEACGPLLLRVFLNILKLFCKIIKTPLLIHSNNIHFNHHATTVIAVYSTTGVLVPLSSSVCLLLSVTIV